MNLIDGNNAVTVRWGIPGLKAAMEMIGLYGGATPFAYGRSGSGGALEDPDADRVFPAAEGLTASRGI